MSYFAELRTSWKPLLAATFGMSTGYGALAVYGPSIIAPHLLAEFGWSKAIFATLTSLALVSAFCIPIAGRVADVLGVRLTAMIGIVMLPITFMLYSLMNGPIWQYIAIYLIQGTLCITTTATVYSRIAVQYVKKARGLSLAIVASGPALMGAVGSPLLNSLVEAQGWRTTYHALAIFTLVSGAITLLLLPSEKPAEGTAPPPRRRARQDYPAIFCSPAFWTLAGAMLLCNLPQVIALSQMKLILLDNGVTPRGASVMLSAFAVGVLVGRFVAGIALDRYSARIVGLIGMGTPSIGLLILASSMDSPAVLTIAVLLLGLSFGAEGDIVAYIVARAFGVAIYSSVLGLMTMAISLSASSGAALLGLTLDLTGGFDMFLLIAAAAVAAGSLLFLLLPAKGEPEVAEMTDAEAAA